MTKATDRIDPRATRRALVVAMVVVVASFSGSLAYSQLRLAPVDHDVLEIQGTATPAIELLAAARGDLMQIGVASSELLFGPPEMREGARREATAARAALYDELVVYGAVPLVPGESEGAAALARDLTVLDVIVDEVLDVAADDGPLEERVAAFSRLTQAREAMSARIERLIEMNAAEIERRLAEIVAARDLARWSALVLGLVSVVAAIVATALMLVTMRHQAALVAERRRFLETKASELEAFAGRVAHDLKNPLGALLLQVDAAQRRFTGAGPQRGDDDALAATFVKLSSRMQSMNRLIDAFLEFARGAARPAADARADVRQVASDVVSDLQPLAEQAATTVRLDGVPAVDVACAPGVLRSVLANLVQNAVKYMGPPAPPAPDAPAAERRVDVRVTAGDDTVHVDVVDTGPGIPPEKASSIFEPFVRATTAQVQGIGLGLATVKRIVESHGGKVGVRSRPGHGSTFWFELPRRRA